jgi:hypothetical protein
MKLRLLIGAMLACMMPVVYWLPASAQPAASDMVTTPRPDSEDPQWGELVEGLQMHAELDTASLTVVCRIRNGCTEAVGYNDYFVGTYEDVWFEMKSETGWLTVWNRLGIQLGVGPGVQTNRVVQPGAMIPMDQYYFRLDSYAYLDSDAYSVKLNLKSFNWPDTIAGLNSVEFRVGYSLASNVDDQSCRWHNITIRSSPMRIDDPAVIGRLASTTEGVEW